VPEEEVRRDLQEWIQAMPVARMLGLSVQFTAGGSSAVRLQVRADMTFDGTGVQAGIVGLVADVAGVGAGASTLPHGWGATTASCAVTNLAPARGSLLHADGTCVRSGRTLLVSTVEVFIEHDGQRRLCAVATTTAVPVSPSQ
jgi:uncharacterized protein (TIGR00369 family)